MRVLRAPYWSCEEFHSSFRVIDIAGIREYVVSSFGLHIGQSGLALAWIRSCILVIEE